MSAVERNPGRTSPSLSPPPRLVAPLFTIRPGRWYGQAAVAGIAVALTLLGVCHWYGPASAAMALAGSMAVLFARGEPYVHRARAALVFGALNVVDSAAAYLAAGSTWCLLGALTVIAGVATWATRLLRTPVPGPALLLVPPTIVAGIPATHLSDPSHRAGMVALGAGVALFVTLSPSLFLRDLPEQRAVAAAGRALDSAVEALGTDGFDSARSRGWKAVEQAERALALARRLPGRDRTEGHRLCARVLRIVCRLHATELIAAHERPSAGTEPPWGEAEWEVAALRDASGGPRSRIRYAGPVELASILRLMAVVASGGVTAISLGLERWYWTPVCAVAVVWGTDAWTTWHRAAQRALGTVAGGLVALVLLQVHPDFPLAAAGIALLFFLGELVIPRNYGIGMVLVTPMVVLTIEGASPVPLDGTSLSLDRIATALLGCAIGVVAVLTPWPGLEEARLADRIAASLRLQSRLVELVAAGSPPQDRVRLVIEVRADLVALDDHAANALTEACHGNRARALWPAAATAQRLGYLLLAHTSCGSAERPTVDDAERWRRALEAAAQAVRTGGAVPISEVSGLPALWKSPSLRVELVRLFDLAARVPAKAGRILETDRLS